MTFGRWRIWWDELAFGYQDPEWDNVWIQRFALKCGACLRWTLSCGDHWLCGMCRDCLPKEDDRGDT